jgi:hypothetical protein
LSLDPLVTHRARLGKSPTRRELMQKYPTDTRSDDRRRSDLAERGAQWSPYVATIDLTTPA